MSFSTVTYPAASFPGLDADTIDFRNRVIANGGTISTAALYAVHRFVKGCKQDGIWDLLLDVGVFVGDNLAAALTKLKYPSGVQSTLTNTNFVAGDYSELIGIKGDGISKFLNTGFVPNSYFANSTNYGASVYLRSPGNAGTQIGADKWILAQNFSGTTYFSIRSSSHHTFPDTSTVGLYSFNGGVFYRNSQVLYSGANTIFTDTANVFVLGRNNSSVPQRSNRTISFYAITQNKSAIQETLYYNCVQNLQQSLGRSV